MNATAETVLVPIAEQIKCMNRAIDDKKDVMSMVEGDSECETSIRRDLITMIAVRESLKSIAATDVTGTRIAAGCEWNIQNAQDV